MKHTCIKCKEIYEDNDPDDYYCPLCLNHKQRIAKEIDKKFANREIKPIKTALQEYDEATGGKGFMRVRL